MSLSSWNDVKGDSMALRFDRTKLRYAPVVKDLGAGIDIIRFAVPNEYDIDYFQAQHESKTYGFGFCNDKMPNEVIAYTVVFYHRNLDVNIGDMPMLGTKGETQ